MVEPVSVPTDTVSRAEGERIFGFRGCLACHGKQLQGSVYLSDAALGQVIATNLTVGSGGVGRQYDDEDWVRAIRYGLRPDGTPLLFMPATEFYYLSDEDLGRVIAFIKSVPAVDNQLPASTLSLTGRAVMTLIDAITFVPAELISHHAPRPIAAFPADYPSPPNLTTRLERPLPYWDEAGFIQIMRSGITRHGRQIDPQYMPWTSYQYATDEELKSIWDYLQALPAVPYGNH